MPAVRGLLRPYRWWSPGGALRRRSDPAAPVRFDRLEMGSRRRFRRCRAAQSERNDRVGWSRLHVDTARVGRPRDRGYRGRARTMRTGALPWRLPGLRACQLRRTGRSSSTPRPPHASTTHVPAGRRSTPATPRSRPGSPAGRNGRRRCHRAWPGARRRGGSSHASQSRTVPRRYRATAVRIAGDAAGATRRHSCHGRPKGPRVQLRVHANSRNRFSCSAVSTAPGHRSRTIAIASPAFRPRAIQ